MTLLEFLKLTPEEQTKRHHELSKHDQFLARVNTSGGCATRKREMTDAEWEEFLKEHPESAEMYRVLMEQIKKRDEGC